jgi:hypothetical protein
VATKLNEVFGIAQRVSQASYVDRGRLDERLRYLLGTGRHIAIHGDSKQGKSWLRNSVLDANDTLAVQCLVNTTPEALFNEALGMLRIRAELKKTKTNDLQGTLDLSAAGELGFKLLAKGKAEAKASGGAKRSAATDTEPIGQTVADLSYVARIFIAAGRRLVVEDFHYVAESRRQELAFILKALGDYGVSVIIVGIWPQDHLLTYYNGDLDGRVEDIRLEWSPGELEEVLLRGSKALNLTMTPALRGALVDDAYGNVGLLQRLAEQVCIAENITERCSRTRALDAGLSLESARALVAESMNQRFEAFADGFVRGMKRMTEGLEVYKHLLRTFTHADDSDLLNGIDSKELLTRINSEEDRIRQSDLTQGLERIDRLQVKIEVQPIVLAYSRSRRRLYLADRAFLFFRKYGEPSWPWDEDQTLSDSIDAVPAMEPLDLDL